MWRVMLLAFSLTIVVVNSAVGQEILDGTWRLVSSKRMTAATGATIDTFGPNPQGYIMYSRDGHMMVLMTRSDRPKPDRH